MDSLSSLPSSPSSPSSPRGRSVLLIASAFPPVGGSGVQRPAKFAKYLHRMGWRVTVCCAKNPPRLPVDASLAADVPPGVKIMALSVHDARRGFERLSGVVRRGVGRSAVLVRCEDAVTWRVGRLLQRVQGWAYPDERWAWALRCFPRLVRMARAGRADVVFSTFSPPSNHLLGWMLNRACGVPWVADFRDLWTDDCAYGGGSRLRRWLDRALQRRFLRDADAVVAVSPEQTRILAGHVRGASDKFVTIPNGVDLEDFDGLEFNGSPVSVQADARHGGVQTDGTLAGPTYNEAGRGAARLVVAHVGRLQTTRFTRAYIEGFARFCEAERARVPRSTGDGVGGFVFRVVGQAPADLIEAIRATGVSVEVTGYVHHDEAIAHMCQADVLLLPCAQGQNAESLIPGKLFEYLGTGRPVWVVGSASSEPWRLVRALDAGLHCPARARDIAATLTALYQMRMGGSDPRAEPGPTERGRRLQLAGCDRERLTPYLRSTLTGRLSTVLETAIARAGRARHATSRERRVGMVR